MGPREGRMQGGAGTLPFIGTFAALPSPQVLSATVPLAGARPGCGWPGLAAPRPLPHPACQLHDLHRNPQGAGGPFRG